jgi:hypothetical protein
MCSRGRPIERHGVCPPTPSPPPVCMIQFSGPGVTSLDSDSRAIKEAGNFFFWKKTRAVVGCQPGDKTGVGHTVDTPGSLKGKKRFNRKIWMLLHSQ